MTSTKYTIGRFLDGNVMEVGVIIIGGEDNDKKPRKGP